MIDWLKPVGTVTELQGQGIIGIYVNPNSRLQVVSEIDHILNAK